MQLVKVELRTVGGAESSRRSNARRRPQQHDSVLDAPSLERADDTTCRPGFHEQVKDHRTTFTSSSWIPCLPLPSSVDREYFAYK